jgi:polysaccharide biosynthesis protein PslH
MRVLHLTTELPTGFGLDGGCLRQFQLCTRAAEAGHEVTVVVPVAPWMHEAFRPADQFARAGVRFVPTRRRQRREFEGLSAVVRRPPMLFRFMRAPYHGVRSEIYHMDMREAIHAELARNPDIVTVDHDFAICLGDEAGSVPKVLMTHNVTSAYYRTRAGSASGMHRRLMSIEGRRMASYVNRRLNGFAGIVTVSAEDAELFRAVTDVPTFVVPNGTALESVGPVPPRRPPELLFTGTMAHVPNRDGILWFASEIWPRIVAQTPDARLLVVGRRPDARVRRLASDYENIDVTGEVPDIRPYFERATAVVVPLRAGGGTRLKILDAFASGRPVISTRIGAQGIEVQHGEQLLLSDEPEEFAERAVELLRDADLRARLSASGRRLVDDRYHWRAIASQYVDALDSIVRQRVSA